MRRALKSDSAEWTQKFGEMLAQVLEEGDLVALAGELAAGKTELVKGIARGLGCNEDLAVASPSYILLREYPGRKWLYHFDFYRLGSVQELEGIGYEEYFEGEGICVVEWADKFPEIFPKNTLWIRLSVLSENERELKLESQSPDRWQERLEQLLKHLKN